MLEESGRTYPLYESLLACAPDSPLKTALESLSASSLHLGQMECRYPLSPSQREALVHHLARPDEAPDVLAVDGPPGTGKTTLLLSAIATMWVQRAVDGAEAPLGRALVVIGGCKIVSVRPVAIEILRLVFLNGGASIWC